MHEAPVPLDEEDRLAALASYEVMDTEPERAFDGITKLVAHLVGVPISLVSLVDADRQWFKSRQGLEVSETPREVSFCGHVVGLKRALIVQDTHLDERFADNPLVLGDPKIRFYVGVPLVTSSGHALGTLCALGTVPNTIEPEVLELLGYLADEVMTQLELRRQQRYLNEERTRLRTVLEAAVDAILTLDRAGVVREVNGAGERLFGYSRAELVGQDVSLLLPEWMAVGRDLGLEDLRTAGALAVGTTRNLSARKKDGSIFPCALSLGEMRLGSQRLFTGILRDMTLVRLAEERRARAVTDLQKSHDDLLLILGRLRVGTLFVDVDGFVTFVNQLYWLERDAWAACVGKRWEEVLQLGTRDRAAIRIALEQPQAGRPRKEIKVGRGAGARWVGLEVAEDPREAEARIVFLYDTDAEHQLRDQLIRADGSRMIGESPVMQELYRLVGEVAKGDWDVLLEGETGTGKELLARAIHQGSPRRDGPFVAVNCAGLTEGLLGSQLFGHVKGAFTGAISDRVGVFEAADGGTLLLDEIGDMPMALQAALLRAVQEREITRIGETQPREVDVRIIAATHRDLQERVAEHAFRNDLLYRIRSARIRVPPLRERSDDIHLLVASFLGEQRVTGGKLVSMVTPQAMARLSSHSWPGNVRELRAAIEHAVIRCRGGRIEPEDLPPEIRDGAMAAPVSVPATDEREVIVEALRRTGGNRSRAARLLGIGRATLYRRLSALNIDNVPDAEEG